MSTIRAGQPSSGLMHPSLGVALTLALMLAAGLMIVLQQPLLAVAIMTMAVGGLAILRSPDLLIPVAVFVLYTNAAVIATHFHGAPAAFGLAPLILLAVLAGRDVFLRGQKVIVTPTLAFLFCFFAIQVVGAFFAVKPQAAVPELITWVVEGLLLYLLVTNAVRTPDQLRMAIWGLLAAGALVGGISALQQITGSFDQNFGGFAQVSDDTFGLGGNSSVRQPRLEGPIGEKNRYAQIMAMLLPLALFQYWSEGSRRLRALALGSMALTAIGFALAFSRGAAVGLALTFFILSVMGYVRWRHLMVVAVVAGATALVVPQYVSRLESLLHLASAATGAGGLESRNTDGSTRGRLTAMMGASLAFADHPVVGVGPGMSSVHYRRYAQVVGGRISTRERQPHSLYLGLAAEHGLLGIGAFGAILFATFRGLNRARRRWRGSRPDLENMATGLEAVLIAYLANSIFLHFAYIRYFWLVMGLAGAASYMARQDEPGALGENGA